MPVPSLRFSLRRLAVLVLLLAAGGAAWFFLIRDDGGSNEPAAEKRSPPKEGPVSDDPIVRKMSVGEQAQQVVMTGFEGTTPTASAVSDIAGREYGAVVVRTENWTGIDAGKKLVAALSGGDGIPPLIAVAQEGGIYRALPDLPPDERALDIGRKGSLDAVRAWALGASNPLAAAGFDLNLFPIADVATLDSPLAGRAFSDDAGDVSAMTEAALEGCDEAGIACAPLHFPGLGAASQDTAEGPATVAVDLATLTSRDLVPFEAVSRKAKAMVLSLALYPDFDGAVPGALTSSVATGLLRDDVGFRGAAISDDLNSGAVETAFPPKDAAVRAINAGIDLVQFSSAEDASAAVDAIEKAAGDGTIDPKRLAQAAERVIQLKRELGLVSD